jgi:hypothetical protein
MEIHMSQLTEPLSPENVKANRIHESARALVMHHKLGDLHPVDFHRLKQELYGDPWFQIDRESLIDMAYSSVGMTRGE